MDKIEPWGDRSLDPRPGVSLYQMGKGGEGKRREMLVLMPIVVARAGWEIASAVLRK